jgi:hypothetical protein
MTEPNQLLERVRAADPLDSAEVDAWWDGPGAPLVLDRVYAADSTDQTAAVARRPGRRVGWIAVAVLLGSGGTVGVAAAAGLLGSPAPDPVTAHLAELDAGLPSDLRYDPDLSHARAGAATDTATLYLADLADGGYCIEVASQVSRPRGASCVPAADLAGLPLDVTAPIPHDDTSPLIVGGRANDERISTIQARYADGVTTRVEFGLDRAWLLEVPETEHLSTLTSGVTITGLDNSGSTVATVQVPALHDDDPLGTAHDTDQPLVVTTISDGRDLTKVLGVHGQVNLTGSVQLQLRFPDGSHLDVPVDDDGTFRLTLPVDRQDDFARSAGSLVALRDGTVVASRPIYSVAARRAGSSR